MLTLGIDWLKCFNYILYKLNSLEKYCADWGMKVNIKKTKIIIFNKAGRTIKKKFLFANEEVECISNYKYLDIHFTASGTFTIAKHELYKKALKAFFKLRKDFLSLNPGRKTCINVFDHTIKPMLVYGSEVWGVFNVTSARFGEYLMSPVLNLVGLMISI